MKQTKMVLALVFAISCLVFVGAEMKGAPVADATAQQCVTSLLSAVEANDYDKFVKDGDAAFKAGITKPMLEGVSSQLKGRMAKGYSCDYLGVLKQQGYQVSLWKMTFKDGGDDVLAKLSMKDGKVGGFLLQ